MGKSAEHKDWRDFRKAPKSRHTRQPIPMNQTAAITPRIQPKKETPNVDRT